MNEQNLDIDFIKTNLDQSGLVTQIGWGAVKALVTTAIIIGAILSVFNVDKLAEYIQIYVYTSIIAGAAISVLFAVQWYYGKLYRLFDVFYTTSIDTKANLTELALRTIASVALALLIAGVLYLSQYYGEIVITIGGCSVVSTGFIYYVFRNRLINWRAYVLFAACGIATGTAAYLLGTLIVIAIGLIGFWLTIGILSLETVFTAVYTYLGLLDWVAHEKEVRKSRLDWEKINKQKEEAKEILGRLTP
jgi:hypothetical protein